MITIIFFSIGKWYLARKFSSQVNDLFSHTEPFTHQRFSASQLDHLPEPVQRYFNHVMEDGQIYVGYVRFKHDGYFKASLDKAWMKIKGEHYATMQTPGFIWKGTTLLFMARDMYLAGHGRLIVSLFSCLNIMDAKGKEKYDSGELLRWLGESILYPTNFLPSQRLQWLAMDATKAKLVFNYNGLSLFFIITFNAIGEITEMETKRFMGEGGLETWVIKASKYEKRNQVLIPTSFDVLWRLDKGDFSYAKFNILDIEYDIPEKF